MEAIFDIWSDFRIDEFSTHQNKTFFFNIILHVVNNVSCIYDETLNLALLLIRKQLNYNTRIFLWNGSRWKLKYNVEICAQVARQNPDVHNPDIQHVVYCNSGLEPALVLGIDAKLHSSRDPLYLLSKSRSRI